MSMKNISVEDSIVMDMLLVDAQYAQKQVDANIQALVKEIGGDADGFEHEVIDQAVLNRESLNWIITQIKEWEEYQSGF